MPLTPEPWVAVCDEENECWSIIDRQPQGSQSSDGDGADEHIADVFDPDNAMFIVTARTALPTLIARVRELEQEIREIVGITADGVRLDKVDDLYCPKCGEKCRVVCDVAYCDDCPNPDDYGVPPLPLFPGSCYSTSAAALAASESKD